MTWVITGGASGIGRRLAHDLIAAGENVVVWDRTTPPFAVDHTVFDLTEDGAIESAATAVDGPLRAFVHCAGVPAAASIRNPGTVSALRLAYEVHVVAFIRATQALLDKLVAGSGSVVAVTSAAMEVVYPGTLAYGASKAALGRAVAQLAVELGGLGVRVNAVSPGAVATPMSQDMWADPEFASARRAVIPLKDQAPPEAITEAIRFLVSAAARFVTGEVLWVDGGVRHGTFNHDVQKVAGTR